MKVLCLILALGFCLITTSVLADAAGDPILIDLDDKGNIRVWTCFEVDGVEVESGYRKIDGKSVYVSGRYNKRQFLGMTTKAEVKERIDKDISIQCQQLIGKEFDKNAVKTIKQMRTDYNRQANQDFMDSNLFPDLIGKKVTEKKASVAFDTDGDGINDKEIIIKTDGSQSISPISP